MAYVRLQSSVIGCLILSYWGSPDANQLSFLKQPDIITQFIFCTDDSTAGMWCPSKPYKYSNCDSHHIVYGENEVGLFFFPHIRVPEIPPPTLQLYII